MLYCNHHKNKNKSAITNISDKLQNNISVMLSDEKTKNTIGHLLLH